MMKKINRKKSTKTENKKQKRRIIKVVCLIVAVMITSAGMYLGFGIFKQVEGFSKEKLTSDESSVLCTTDGEEWFSVARGGVQKNVSYNDIPQVMIDAVVAAEDSRFFEHNGFDVPRIVKALLGNIAAGGITAGGSTITQQLIKKSYYPDEEQTIERKIGEIILSIEATSQISKEEVLELYLNKIYFGYGPQTVGIYAASRYYFDKSVQNLTLPEAALLAGTLNSPNRFDPFRNLDLAQDRRDTILGLMLQHGYISKEECEATKAIPVENTLKSNPISTSGQYQAYADKVIREVQETTGYDPYETPMRIYTYIDTDVQKQLDDIASGETYDFQDSRIQVGAVIQESTTGRIVGVLSGRDYTPLGTTYAYASQTGASYGQKNQPGSSLKPLISYASAFEFLDYSTAHYVHDVPYEYANGFVPSNWNGRKYNGDISISSALSNSWNAAALQTFSEVITGKDCNGNDVGDGIGIDGATQYLESLGFDMEGESVDIGYAIGAWRQGVTPESEAGAYAVIANGGTYIEPHTVQKIELLTTGEVIEIDQKYQEEKTQALSEESAYMIRDIMTDYVKSGTGMYSMLNLGYQIGAKSGTSNHADDTSVNEKIRGQNKDAWLSAFSPDYTWSVWTGYNAKDQKKGYYTKSNRDSNNIATMIAKFLHEDGMKNSYPSQPSGLVEASCVSGIYPYVTPGEGVPDNRVVSGLFKKNNTPSGSANGSSLNNLSSFTAELADDKLNVTFTEYDPKSMTEDATPTKTYTAGGNSYTLPYLGNINQLYGKVVYKVDIADASGNVVHSETLNSATGTINYTLSPGTYTVTGYYAFESGNGTSNKISQTITVEDTTPASYTRTALTESSVTYQVTVPSGTSITASLNGTNQTLQQSGTITFSQLSAGTTYSVTFTHTQADGQTVTLGTDSFMTTSQTQQPDPTQPTTPTQTPTQ